jgi:hypothetical protein
MILLQICLGFYHLIDDLNTELIPHVSESDIDIFQMNRRIYGMLSAMGNLYEEIKKKVSVFMVASLRINPFSENNE